MEALDLLLRLIGAFYVFAGYFATKVTLTAAFADQARAAIENVPPARIPRQKALYLLVTSTLVLVGGLMLFLLIAGAQWVFLASAVWQFAYLNHFAPRYFDKEDAPTNAGRQQNLNAFFIYCAATAIVLLCAKRLLPLDQHAPFLLSVTGILVAAHVLYVVSAFRR